MIFYYLFQLLQQNKLKKLRFLTKNLGKVKYNSINTESFPVVRMTCRLEMSDIVTILDLKKVKNHIQLVNPNQCLQYVGKQCVSTEKVVFTVHIAYPTLRYWYTCETEGGLLSQICSYIEILNCYLNQISGYNAFQTKSSFSKLYFFQLFS